MEAVAEKAVAEKAAAEKAAAQQRERVRSAGGADGAQDGCERKRAERESPAEPPPSRIEVTSNVCGPPAGSRAIVQFGRSPID